jgi:hypothetical protein
MIVQINNNVSTIFEGNCLPIRFQKGRPYLGTKSKMRSSARDTPQFVVSELPPKIHRSGTIFASANEILSKMEEFA